MPTTFTWAIASVSRTFIQTLPKWRLTTICKPFCLSLLLASQSCVFWEAFSSCTLEIKGLLLLSAAALRETSVPLGGEPGCGTAPDPRTQPELRQPSRLRPRGWEASLRGETTRLVLCKSFASRSPEQSKSRIRSTCCAVKQLRRAAVLSLKLGEGLIFIQILRGALTVLKLTVKVSRKCVLS